MFGVFHHHRRIRYRPPRREYDSGHGQVALFKSFVQTYLRPYSRPLLTCMLLVSINSCSVYLMAF